MEERGRHEMRSIEKIIKMSPVSLLLWLVQLLSACAIQHNTTSTDGQDEVTSNPQLTIEYKKIHAVTATTVSSPVEEFLTKWTRDSTSTMQPSVTKLHANTAEAQRSSANAEGLEKSSNTTSHPDHRFVSPIFFNSTSTAKKNIETGTRSTLFTTGFKTDRFTSQKMVYTDQATDVNNWESGTSLQTKNTVQTTDWIEERSEATGSQIEADGTTLSLDNLRNKSEETQSDKGSYNLTFAQHSQAHTTAALATTPYKVDSKTSLANSTTGYTNVLRSSKHGVGGELTTGYYVETTEVVSATQATSSKSETISSASLLSTEEPLVSSRSMNTVSAVSPGSGTDQTTKENVTTTTHSVIDTTWKDSPTMQNTERLSASSLTSEGSYNFTSMEQQDHTTVNYNPTNTELDKYDGNHTTPGNSTVGMINASSKNDLDGQMTTGYYITTPVTQFTPSEGKNISMRNMEEHPVSTTSANTAVLETSSQSTTRNVSSVSYSTGRDRMTRTEATTTPSLSHSTAFPVNITTTPNDTQVTNRNVSRETDQPVWTNCFSNESSSKTQRSSKLICFITLWCLGMTASIFLGLTVFLWVRLSVVRKEAKRKYKGVKSTGKERQSLWATNTTLAEERVEFWYANGSTLEADKKAREQERAKRNGNGKNEGKGGDMWIQPKVTPQDIAEFWYANGRERNEDRMETQREDSHL
ncbi:factor-induced gene 2 protein-like [Astyanax mexicanus]|uniref:Factor-induced gene 2 protein-like n=1 Tax=Astyanax mexicanus TaxID=7994 RepID=A0A8T2L2H9_ASTMX|nr:factor-induced gene 2 protein-like [Astyanax mexicanus]